MHLRDGEGENRHDGERVGIENLRGSSVRGQVAGSAGEEQGGGGVGVCAALRPLNHACELRGFGKCREQRIVVM